jgi:D-beta-D-heptose 7-phosphate kinase/D-beta-D-heptose 1-phosphate adenosyltransferase
MSLDTFPSVRVAVLGDVILDEYVYGRVNRISPEAPVPVLEVQTRTESLGGAGNVARNIASLDGKVSLFSVVGADATSDRFRNLARESGIDCAGLLTDPARVTTLKQRVGALTQQIVRIDSEVVAPIGEDLAGRLAGTLEAAASTHDVLLISDYDKGVLTESLLKRTIAAFRSAKKPIVVDPNVVHFFRYADVTVVTPNHLQLERVSGRRIRTEQELFEAGFLIRSRLGSAALLITRGEAGMALVDGDGVLKIPTVAREVYDVTGAGDTVVSVLALGLGSGASLPESARMANAAAGIVVGKRGTAVVTQEELASRLRELALVGAGATVTGGCE